MSQAKDSYSHLPTSFVIHLPSSRIEGSAPRDQTENLEKLFMEERSKNVSITYMVKGSTNNRKLSIKPSGIIAIEYQVKS